MKALFCLIASLLMVLTPVQAQTVYRCGSSYSQQPCPGGNALDASDSRTPERRKAHEASVRQEKRSGDAMERSREKEETAAVRAAQQADKAQRTAEKDAQKSAVKKKAASSKDKLPAYRAPATQP